MGMISLVTQARVSKQRENFNVSQLSTLPSSPDNTKQHSLETKMERQMLANMPQASLHAEVER